MKVLLSVDNDLISPKEATVVDMLCESLKKDVVSLSCPHCAKESEVILHINTSKMSALRLEVKACCKTFENKIENTLAVNA